MNNLSYWANNTFDMYQFIKVKSKVQNANPLLVGRMAVAIVLLTLTGFQAQAQRMVPDRPGFLTGTHTVSPGRFYLESGLQFSYNTNELFRNYTDVPMLNLRTGLGEKTELFLLWDGINLMHRTGEPSDIKTEAGLNLPGLGAKQRMFVSETVNITLMGIMEISDESDGFPFDPSVALLWDYELNDLFELFGIGQLGMEWQDEEYFSNMILGLGLGFAPGSRTETFVELYSIHYPDLTQWFHGTEFGLMYFVNDNLQLDMYAGFSFGNKLYHYTGMGIAQRF